MSDQVSLPKKLSELAQMALDDVEALELRADYKINMGSWHDPSELHCAVCAAGAVMVQRLQADPDTDYWPSDFGHENGRALFAIDYLRQGDIGSALAMVNGDVCWSYEAKVGDVHPLDRIMPAYESGERWHAAMRRLVADLREAGL